MRGAVVVILLAVPLLGLPFAAATLGPIGSGVAINTRDFSPTSSRVILLSPLSGGVGLASVEMVEPPTPVPHEGMVKVGQGQHVEFWADDACKSNSKNGGADDFPNSDNVSKLIDAFDNKTYPGYDKVFNQQPNMRVNIISIDGPQNVGGNCCSGNSMNVDCADVYDRQYSYFAGPMIVAHEAYHYIHSGSAGQWVEEGQANMGGAMTTGPNDLSLLSGILGFFRQKHNEPIETCCSDAIQYGRAYSFWEYLVEEYCGNATRRVVFDNPSSGGAAQAAQQCGNSGATFDTLLTEWEVANYVGNPPVGRYGYNQTMFMERMSESADDKVSAYPHNGQGTAQKHAAWYAAFTVKAPQKGDVIVNFTASSGTLRAFLAGTPTQKGATPEVKEIALSGGKGTEKMSGLGLGFKDIGLVVSGIAQGSFTYDVNLLGPTNGSLGGRTIDQSFASVPDAKVLAYQNGSSTIVAQTTSDSSGNYLFPSLKAGTYDLVGNKTGYADGRANGISLVGGQSASQNVQLRKLGPQDKPGTVQGKVTDTTANPLPGVAVSVFKAGDRTNPVATATSDAAGNYAASAMAGSYDLVARLSGYKDSEVPGVAIAGGATVTKDIVMRPDVPDGTVTGVVKEKGSGALLQGAEVGGYVGAIKVSSATTDAAGAYSLGLPPGNYDIRASKPGYIASTVSGVKVESAKSSTRDFELEKSAAQPGKGALKVTVKDEAGSPLEGATVQATGPEGRTGKTDASGAIQWNDLTPGKYGVSASLGGHKTASATVDIVRDEGRAVELTLEKVGQTPPPSPSILDLQVGGVPVVGLVVGVVVIALLLAILLMKFGRKKVACGNCGFQNQKGAQMCGQCTAPMLGGSPVPPR